MVQLSELTVKILGWHLLWPEKMNFWYFLKCAALLSYMTICAIGMICHFIYSFTNEGFIYFNIADDMAGSLATFTAIYVILVHIINTGTTKKLLIMLSDFTVQEKPHNVEALDKHLKLISIIMICGLYVSMFLQWSAGILANCPETGEVSDCSFIVTAYLPGPINIFVSPYRQIFMTLQVSSAFITGICAFFSSWVQLSISQFIVNRLQHLKFMLKEILVLKNRDKRRRHIKTCVLYQYKINEIWYDFKNCSKNVFLTHISFTPVVMSMIIYQLIYQFKFVNFIHLIVWNFAAFGCCYYGEKLITESETLMYSVYDNIPFDGDVETMRDMLLIMKRAMIVMYISASDFAICGHVTYMTLLKTVYSYLTILIKT